MTKIVSINSHPIYRLAGFRQEFKNPKEINAATQRFVQTCALPDIQAEMESIWLLCREELKYKRKDKSGPIIEAGIGSIEVPGFTYTAHAQQDHKDPKLVTWHRSINNIKDINIVLGDPFNRIFSKKFDTLEEDFSSLQNMELIIDRVENLDSKLVSISYPSDCSFCEISIKTLGLSILITPSRSQIKLINSPSPKVLVESVLQIQQLMHDVIPENSLLTFS
jgi:hypothetical protein